MAALQSIVPPAPGHRYGPDPFPDDPYSWTREVFRWVEGYPGYCVGSNGSVWTRFKSTGRIPGGKRGGACLAERWRPRRLDLVHGYPVVILTDVQGSRKAKAVHVLVLEAFVGPRPPGMQACHRDGVRANARFDNLRWDTIENNMADKVAHGTSLEGERHGMSKLTWLQVEAMRKLWRDGYRVAEIGRRFGMSWSQTARIVSRKNWKEAARG